MMLELSNPSFNPEILYLSDGYFREGEQSQPHYHDSIEISIVLEGPTYYCINEKNYLVNTGDIIILNPYSLHYEAQKKGKSHHMHLGLDNFQFLGYEKNVIPLTSPVIRVTDIPKLNYLTNRLLDEKKLIQPYQELEIKLLTTQFLIFILREIENQSLALAPINQKERKNTALANSIKYYLEAHHSEDISLDSLSSSMYISPTYMSKLFKQETGDSPINYLISVRMEKAKELLTNQELTIKEVATSVGYQDAYHFSKLFKKWTGTSPREFAKDKK